MARTVGTDKMAHADLFTTIRTLTNLTLTVKEATASNAVIGETVVVKATRT